MSELSYLEKLLDGAEVEWIKLSDLVDLRRGRVMSKGYFVDNIGRYPVYSSQTANNGMIGSIDTFDFDGEFVSWTTDGANAGTVFYRTGKFSITNVCGLIKINDSSPLNYKYLFYWLTIEAKSHVYSGMGNPKLMSHQVEKIPVPIPCPNNPEKSLAIQSEIVRILDKFTALTAELTAELTARKKQYNYYRDQLLSFKEGEVEWKALGELADICDGTHQTPKYTESGIPFVSVQNIKNIYGTDKFISADDFAKYKMKPCKHDIFMTRIGDIGTCAIVDNDEPLAYYVTLALIRANRFAVLPKFIFHFIESGFGKAELYKRTLTTAVPIKINLGDISKVTIPIPCPNNPEKSLAIQSEIVRILDKFDSLTNSINEGLPREIELRQKQYEYYRDLLFSFPKPEAVTN